MNCPPAVLCPLRVFQALSAVFPRRGLVLGLPAVLLLGLFGIDTTRGAMVDLNGNGMSDIWEILYNAGGLPPNGDADGDGVSNLTESRAGTDPLNSNSVPKITALAHSATNFAVSMPCEPGKQYQLQSVQPVGPGPWTNWTIESTMVARTGTVVTLTAPVGVSSKFFRIAIADVDSDGDGVNDWEEYKLGLDPLNPASNGQLDSKAQPLNDYDYVVGRLAAQNVVTLTSTDPVANQPDPSQSPINLGVLTLSRGGFPLNSITVGLGLGGPGPGMGTEGVDFGALPRSVSLPAGTSSQTITVTPLANPGLRSPVLAMLKVLAGTGYTMGTASNASVVIYPSATPNGTGLTGWYYTNASSTYASSANFTPANLVTNRLDATIDFIWGPGSSPAISNHVYSVRWTGQILPQYSETYYFDAYTDDGVKLWVNDQLIIDAWTVHGVSDSIGTIALQGGVRYDIKMEYFNNGGSAAAHLNWYSASQPKQIIPANCLYPSTATPAPSAVISSLTAYAFLGQPFSYTVTGANSAFSYAATGLPPGLSFNTTNGVISGIPSLAGDYQVSVTASNTVGLGASVVDLQVIDTGTAVTREVWTNAPGINISDLPLALTAATVSSLGTLEGLTDFGDNYGERIRGFLTAPVTGNYYFWMAGSDSAELWISTDNEPCNKVRRAYVSPSANPTPPPANGTAPRQWTLQPNQKSPWLSLVAGQRYYLEVLHKAGVGTGDNWGVAWLQDPTGTNNTPGGIVPGYVLSPYYPAPAAYQAGTLYNATMLAQQGIASSGVGTASLRVSADGSQALLRFSYSGLTSPVTGEHIHTDSYLGKPSEIIFDIDTATPQPDGSYVWNIGPVSPYSQADIQELIKEGLSYINIHTANNPAGEINGHFTPANGTQTFTAPPPPPVWTDDHTSSNAAARFLMQATFGPSAAEIANVQALGYAGWISNQFTLPVSHHLPVVLSNLNYDLSSTYLSSQTYNAWWQQSVSGPDQLRQRVAFALSQIMVVSQNGVLLNLSTALSGYYDTLLDNAFGNYRALLRAVTLSPAMGLFLDMRRNDVGNIITGIHANENYAREIQQLFSIGLYRMWPDGTLVLNSQDSLVPTYDQNVIMGFASVFTGWNYYQANQANGRLPTNWNPPADYVDPMVLVPTHHELGTKRLLDNAILPQAWGSQAASSSTNFDIYCSQDLESALDALYNHQNVGPFICRQLIQRLVTSNPSRDYLYRAVQVFNDNGSGVRGDLSAVVRAILLDYEARSPNLISSPTYGKQREPLLRVTAAARAFPAPAPSVATYTQTGTQTISVTNSGPHRLGNGDFVELLFTDTSGQPAPASQRWSVSLTGSNTFNLTDPNLASGTYTQTTNTTVSNAVTATIVTTNVITVNLSGFGLMPGNPVYLVFPTGGASNGLYQIIYTNSANAFIVTTADATNRSGACLMPRLNSGASYSQTTTILTISVSGVHGLHPGDSVYLRFTAGTATSGTYPVVTVPDPSHFTTYATVSASQTINGIVLYPLVAPPMPRSGTLSIAQGTWNLQSTDTSLSQSPLNSPTVFNFYFPDFAFPGALESAGLTTPEFQLTTDSGVASQMNFLAGGLLNNTGNTNGLSSFSSGNGSLVLDIGPWMTTDYTSTSGSLSNLVDSLSTLLTAGQLSAGVKSQIVNYALTLSYSTPPTFTQMRDRVRAVAHLLLTSPDYTIQK